jgi:hypothetical protein
MTKRVTICEKMSAYLWDNNLNSTSYFALLAGKPSFRMQLLAFAQNMLVSKIWPRMIQVYISWFVINQLLRGCVDHS